MEYQLDFIYHNGAADFAHIFGEEHLAKEIASIDWHYIESISIKPWED